MRERRGQAAKRERTAVTAERAADRQQRKRGTQERGVLVEAGDLRSNCERCVLGVGGSDGHATELSGPYAAQKHGCMIHERRNTPQASEASRQTERRTRGGRGLAVKLRAVCVGRRRLRRPCHGALGPVCCGAYTRVASDMRHVQAQCKLSAAPSDTPAVQHAAILFNTLAHVR